jgi:hypothetical protein
VTPGERQKLRAAAWAAVAATPSRTSVERALDRWELQTSNSFRRIGCHGDGDVLCATTQRSDGHPDLLAPAGVLDYVIAAQPRAVLELIDDLQQCEEALTLSRKQHEEDHVELARLRDVDSKLQQAKILCDKTAAMEQRLLDANMSLSALVGIVQDFATSDDPTVIAAARTALAQLTESLTKPTTTKD